LYRFGEEAIAQTGGEFVDSTISGLEKFHWIYSVESYLRVWIILVLKSLPKILIMVSSIGQRSSFIFSKIKILYIM